MPKRTNDPIRDAINVLKEDGKAVAVLDEEEWRLLIIAGTIKARQPAKTPDERRLKLKLCKLLEEMSHTARNIWG